MTELNRRFDPSGAEAQSLNAALEGLLAGGAIADPGALPVMWSRVTKATEESQGFSIDVVRMSGPGPRHRHPKGEVNYCLAREGTPTFDGSPAGWVVMPPDSVHVPTVADGEMLIVYLLPEGAMEFLEAPA